MDRQILGLMIPIIAIVMGCAIPIVAIIVDYRKRKEMFSLYHQERMAAIEKGVELPPLPESFFKDYGKEDKKRSPHADFGWGLFWLLGGVALLIALYINETPAKSLFALIPIAVGIHYLIYYFVVGKKEALALEAERKNRSSSVI